MPVKFNSFGLKQECATFLGGEEGIEAVFGF